MNIWDQLVDCICRPPRDCYAPHELLGGAGATFVVGHMECTRLDYELTNKQGLKLMCSHYLPLDAKADGGSLPVVVYCHCNSGSRRDAEEALYHLLPCGVGVVAFDFTGSGLSDGKWVTLGANEVEDLAVVVDHLRQQGGVSAIGLWGRSMGAVTALLYSHRDPDIAGMVLDSPFSRLTDLMLEIVVGQRLPIPKVMLRLALRLMRTSVRRKAGADITTVSPLDVVPQAAIPAMFGHGEDDTFIGIAHSVKLFENYNSAAPRRVYKNLVRFRGEHNSPRPPFFYSSVCCFFHQQLQLDKVLLGGNPADAQQLLHFGSLSLSAAASSLDRANGFITTPPWDLQPMASLSPEEHAAAAALLATAEAECPSSSGGGGVHMTSGGLNSPRGGSPTSRAAGAAAGHAAEPHHRVHHTHDHKGHQQHHHHSSSSSSRHRHSEQQPQAQHLRAAAGAAGSRSSTPGIQCKRLPAEDDALLFSIGSRGAQKEALAAEAATPSPPGSTAGAVPAHGDSCASSSSSGGGCAAAAAGCGSGSTPAAAGAGAGLSPSPGSSASALKGVRWPWKRSASAAGAAATGDKPPALAHDSPSLLLSHSSGGSEPGPVSVGRIAPGSVLAGGYHSAGAAVTTTGVSPVGQDATAAEEQLDGDLAAAIAASLRQQQISTEQLPSQEQPQASLRAAPSSVEEEQAMLQQAIELSLASPQQEPAVGSGAGGLEAGHQLEQQ